MDDAPDINRRRYPRLNTDENYLIHLYHEGQRLEGARIQNISAVGCAVQLPCEEAVGMAAGSLLDPIYVDHPSLPLVPLLGNVAWVLGRAAGRSGGYVVAGIEFSAITPMVQNLIQAHVHESSL